jgi:hypothetical protein
MKAATISGRQKDWQVVRRRKNVSDSKTTVLFKNNYQHFNSLSLGGKSEQVNSPHRNFHMTTGFDQH